MKGICKPKENGRSGLVNLLDSESVNFAIEKTHWNNPKLHHVHPSIFHLHR